jgi:hypothetical protein
METPLSSTTNFVFKSLVTKLNRFYVYGSKNRSVACVKELFYSRTRKVKKAIYMRHLNPKSVEAKKKKIPSSRAKNNILDITSTISL